MAHMTLTLACATAPKPGWLKSGDFLTGRSMTLTSRTDIQVIDVALPKARLMASSTGE